MDLNGDVEEKRNGKVEGKRKIIKIYGRKIPLLQLR